MRAAIRFEMSGSGVRIGRLEGESVVDAGESGPRGFDASAAAWRRIEDANGARFDLADVRILAPTVPDSVLCVGLNYTDHIQESNLTPPAAPVIFTKLSSAIIGPGDPIVLPVDEPQPDWEAEMAIVIGAPARRVSRADAAAVIGGVTAVNDVSGRHAQLKTGGGQFVRGKSFDTFCPIGPAVVHPEDVEIGRLAISLRVNGEVMQSSNTEHLLFDSAFLVEWLSAGITLRPGDVISTGTPGGVGLSMVPPRFLQPGDIVEVDLEGVGVLRNPVIAESAG